jgi:two-component system cell cycle sensor histidine kinase/response regulator CckA
MKEKKTGLDRFAALRGRAEEALRGQPLDLAVLSPEEVRRLIHELRVHQIELELQNEELRRAQRELEVSREKYFDLYDLAPVGYITLSGQGLILEANLTAATMLGMERGSLVKQPLTRFIAREDQDVYYFLRQQLFETQALQVCETRMVRKDGSRFWAWIEATMGQDSEGDGPVCRATMSDITERKLAERVLLESNRRLEETLAELKATQQQALQRERLAAVGQLAAGIAHDFNNIMAVIVLYTAMALQTSDLPPEIRQRLETIAQQSRRATDLVQRILDFGRRSVLQRRPTDLVLFLKEQVKFLTRILSETIRIEVVHRSGEYIVNADPTRMQQVIMNLALNARDAMPEGGRLLFGLDRLRIEVGQKVPLPEMEAGEWVQVTVSDSGTGIPPDVLPYIFEPFFTTKFSEGSGLGLAQVFGIVKQHEGHIDVSTQVGEGTTFALYLPALLVSRPETQMQELPPMVQGRGETILTVENDSVTREAMVTCLEMLNYRALEAANGQQALVVLEQHEGEIALVLCDLVMPLMGGLELVRELKQRRLPIKVLMLTGHPLDVVPRDVEPDVVVGWVQKPPDMAQLSEVIAQALQGH